MSCPPLTPATTFQRNVSILKQTNIVLADACKDAGRLATVNEFLAGWNFNLSREQVRDIAAGRFPQTISGPQMAVRNCVKALDCVRRVSRQLDRGGLQPEQQLFELAVIIDPARNEYGFPYEDFLRDKCRFVACAASHTNDEWENVLSLFRTWKWHESLIPYSIGVASLLCILEKCFMLAADILSDWDFSLVVNSIYCHAPGPLLPKAFGDALYATIAAAADEISRQRPLKIDVELLPLLKLFMGDKTFFRSELMELLGVNNRLRFVEQLLKPALEKKLIAPTEHSPNSPKQKYRLTTKGEEQMWAAGKYTSVIIPRF